MPETCVTIRHQEITLFKNVKNVQKLDIKVTIKMWKLTNNERKTSIFMCLSYTLWWSNVKEDFLKRLRIKPVAAPASSSYHVLILFACVNYCFPALHRCTGRASLALLYGWTVIKEELQGAVSQRAVSAQTSNSSLKNPLTPTQRPYSPLTLTPNLHPVPSLCPRLRSKLGLGIFHCILLLDHFQYSLCLCPGWKNRIHHLVVMCCLCN